MNHHWVVLVEFLSLEGVFVGWGLWQLWSLRRERKQSQGDKPTDPAN